MPAGHGDIVQEDVTVRVATRRSDVLVEQESTAGIRSTLHHEQRRPGSQSVDGTLMRFGRERTRVPVTSLSGIRARDVYRASHLGAAGAGRAGGATRKFCSAVTAEATAGGILPATCGADHSPPPSVVRRGSPSVGPLQQGGQSTVESESSLDRNGRSCAVTG